MFALPEKITIEMSATKAGRLSQLALQVAMPLADYCAMVLANHIMRKAEIDDKGEEP